MIVSRETETNIMKYRSHFEYLKKTCLAYTDKQTDRKVDKRK